jgi:signal transduction histidine kinase
LGGQIAIDEERTSPIGNPARPGAKPVVKSTIVARRSGHRGANKKIKWSLRFNVALLVVGVVLAPLLLVAGWLGMERQFESSMQTNAAFTLKEAVLALTLPPAPVATGSFSGLSSAASSSAGSESALSRVARLHRVRVRLLDEQGVVLEDDDFDSGRDLSERAGGVVLRPSSARLHVTADDRRGNIAARAEVRDALQRGEAQGCEDASDGMMVVCFAARKTELGLGQKRVVHVQDSAERPLPLLYALRFQLGRLTLVILPFALVLAFVVGRRLVGPLEALRDQVLSKVREQRPHADLRAPATSETAQLADAFNTLLERLEQRRHENEAFVADLVHEFKNPVATIRACGESLSASEVTPERAERLARLLLESSTRLDLLVSQFLELARAEAGMEREDRASVDLTALAAARVARARQDERWKALSFELQAAPSVHVRGVAERLQTVLDNLLANAASFAREGGCVQVEVAVEAAQIVLRVTDDGPGIAPEDLPRVFERFFTTRRHDKGTGLGLALVRAIVEAHGGNVSATSVLGQGATFSAAFPAS